MKELLFGEIGLVVMGEENFNTETFVGARLQVVRPDGSTVEFDVCEVLHKDLKSLDGETGIEVQSADEVAY